MCDRRRLAHPLTGGIILFGRNWQDRDQLAALCAEIKSVRQDLLICVDHEGGRVQRFRTGGFTHLPPMRALGELWMNDQGQGGGAGAMAATNAATAVGYVLGAELRACGVDFSFTPVLDLDWGESGVIGDRSFHRDPRVAALLAKSLMHGLLRAGMANCGKHFPGHGFVKRGFAYRNPGGPAQPQGDPGRRRGSLPMAQHVAVQRNAGSRRLSRRWIHGRRVFRAAG